MKCYYPTDKSGNRIGFKTPEACIYDTSGTNLTNKLNKLRTDVNGKAAASHGNHVPAPQTANSKVYLRNDNTWHTITPSDIGAAASSHGNHVPAPQTANNKIYLRNDNTWHTITPSDIGAAASSHSHSWDSITSKPSLYTTSQIDSKVSEINSNITNISNETLLYTDYTSKCVLGTQNNHIGNIEEVKVIKKGHICNVKIAARVKGTWTDGDEHPWIIGKLPKPLLEGGFQFSGYSTTNSGVRLLRFILNESGWIKPFHNIPDVTDGIFFMLYCSYITAD